jgi:23S rRNA (uracil1939-C5)-methyltransferase
MIGRLSIRARLPQIEVSAAENAVSMVFRVLDLPNKADKALLRDFAEQHALRVYLQPGGLNSLQLLYPDTDDQSLYYTLPNFDIRVEFGPLDFVQINGEINRKMVDFAIQELQAGADDSVLDLFCGIGNFSLPLARHGGKVLGIEGEQVLVDRATHNAASNNLRNVEFRRADLNKIDGSESWINTDWDRVLLDPARSGAAEIVNRMHLLDPKRIVYVSCHPGTLARDAAVLVHEKGYLLETAGIIDMFPHTAHVESIAVFTKS